MTQTIVHVPASEGGGSFDPTDITLTDNTSGAFLIKEGSNEYMRIDTTDTQEKTTFTTQSGANTGFFVSVPTVGDVFSIIRGGSPSTRASIGTGVTLFQVDSDKILNDLISDAKTFKVDGTSVSPLVITGDSNATFTLGDSSAAVFKVENPTESYDYLNINEANNRITIQTGQSNSDYIILKAGGYEALGIQGNTNTTFTLNNASGANFKINAGSTTYMNVETVSGSEKTTFLVPKSASNDQIVFGSPDHEYLKLGHHSSSSLGASFAFVSQGGTNVNFGYNAHDSGGIEFNTATNKHCDVRLESGASFHIKDPNANLFTVDQDSNATFTLDSSSTSNFKVVDDAGSPTTYIDIESGSTEKVKIPIVGLTTVRAIGGEFIANVSNTTGIALNTFPLNYANTLLTFDQTADGTTSNQSTKPGLTVVYSSSASGAATSSGITLQLAAGIPADGTTSPQYLVLHNQNSTHSAKFILDGSGFYSGHEVATSGSDAADLIGSGFTLAAGKFAVFSILACRVTNTGDHYFYAVSLHTKT